VEVRAVAKNINVSARKIRPLVDMVRGKKVEEALDLLKFTPTPKARVITKLVKSAAASAENNFQMATADLRIVSIFADEARTLKRYRPRARGRAGTIGKHFSHIKVIVAEEEA
jgi:large subunit ribosomal protein L22